jgi:hypothetical protein
MHSLFSMMEGREIEEIAASMKLATADNGAYIFSEGDHGDCFFMLKQGTV